MQIYVVNLRRRADRRAAMEAILSDEASVVFTSDWDGPFDGAVLDLGDLGEFATYGGWQLPVASGHRYWDRPLLGGEVGCSLSHIHCWRHAIVHVPREPIVVLEDDVTPVADLSARVAELTERATSTDPNWGLLYLGRSGHASDSEVDELLVRPGFSYGSFGYVLSPRGLRSVTDSELGRAVIPVDEFLPACYLDHPRPDIRMLYPRCLTAFASRTPLVVADMTAASDSERDAKSGAPRSGWL